jgi:hypothetical protein
MKPLIGITFICLLLTATAGAQYKALYKITSPDNKEDVSLEYKVVSDGQILMEIVDFKFIKIKNYFDLTNLNGSNHIFTLDLQNVDSYVKTSINTYLEKCEKQEFAVSTDTLNYDLLLKTVQNPNNYKAIKYSEKYDYPFISIHFLGQGLSNIPSSCEFVKDNFTINYTLVNIEEFSGQIELPSKDELGKKMSVESFCSKKNSF